MNENRASISPDPADPLPPDPVAVDHSSGPPDQRYHRLVFILLFVVGVLVWREWQEHGGLDIIFGPQVEPRPIAPRGDLAEDEKTTIALFQQASPSVVHITSLEVRQDAFRLNAMEIPKGTGSGFIWDDQGHVVTNYHVIESAQAATVTLFDGSTWEARLVGFEADKDLAVLKINIPKHRLHPILVGTSADLAVGQKVFAIGNPFGLDQTLTTGIISGIGREIQSVTKRPIQGVIQTDAAINPGNSGGPLLDSAGRLIGVNTAIYSPSGVNTGIGFAVPVDTVNRIVPQIIQHGKAEKVGIGISIFEDQKAAQLGLKGVLVFKVVSGGPAEKAGVLPTRMENRKFKLGDLIIAIDSKPVADSASLYRFLDHHKADDKIVLTVLRDGKELKIPVTLEVLH